MHHRLIPKSRFARIAHSGTSSLLSFPLSLSATDHEEVPDLRRIHPRRRPVPIDDHWLDAVFEQDGSISSDDMLLSTDDMLPSTDDTMDDILPPNDILFPSDALPLEDMLTDYETSPLENALARLVALEEHNRALGRRTAL